MSAIRRATTTDTTSPTRPNAVIHAVLLVNWTNLPFLFVFRTFAIPRARLAVVVGVNVDDGGKRKMMADTPIIAIICFTYLSMLSVSIGTDDTVVSSFGLILN